MSFFFCCVLVWYRLEDYDDGWGVFSVARRVLARRVLRWQIGSPRTLYMCPHAAVYVSSYCYIRVLILLYGCRNVSSYCYICVLILLYMCPHTAMYVSSYYYILSRLAVSPLSISLSAPALLASRFITGFTILLPC